MSHISKLVLGIVIVSLLFLNTIHVTMVNMTSAQTPSPSPSPLQGQQFSTSGPLRDLTGTYSTNDGGTYYVRQIGNNLLWVGVSTNNDGRDYTNVFIGTIQGDTVTGNWADVPRGRTQNYGVLTLNIVTSPTGTVGFQKRGFTLNLLIKITISVLDNNKFRSIQVGIR
jgi:hypothetical protein